MLIPLLSSIIATGALISFTGFKGADRYNSYVRAGSNGELFMRPRPWERSSGLGIVYRGAYLRGVRMKARRTGLPLKKEPSYEGYVHIYREMGDVEACDNYLRVLRKRLKRQTF